MLEKVQKFITDKQLLNKNDQPVIVGVSGGRDSVVLLHILSVCGYNCIIAHCNFHLRSEESNRDYKFVRNMGINMNIPIENIDFNTITYAEKHKISIEMAARELRYNWFEKLRIKHNAQAIATGHHADDNAETVLMNLVRGTGLKGLTGIPLRNGIIIRPLLCSSRKEISEYIRSNQLEFVEDSSNNSHQYTRNKFRHEIIPALESINPAFRQNIQETIENLSGAYTIYNRAISSIREDITSRNSGKILINIDKLNSCIEKENILFEILNEYQFHPYQIRQIYQGLDGDSGKIFISGTHQLLKDRDQLIIKTIDTPEELITDIGADTHIHKSFRLSTRIFKKDPDFRFSEDNNLAHLDADKIHFPLQLRKWQRGDFFYPLGMNNKQKLSDFFINQKTDRFEKENIRILVSGYDIVWVTGMRIDNRFKVTPETRNILEVYYQPE